MENKNQQVLVTVLLSTLLFITIIFIGMGYAFFTANNPEGSTAEIISKTGRMVINYDDGTDNIVPVTGIVPSNAILVDKTFSLTGSNTTVGMKTGDGLPMPYKVGVQYTSGFSDGMLHYYIKEVNRSTNSNVTANYVITPETGKTENDYKNQTVPGNDTYTGYTHGTFKNGSKYTEMVTGIFPASLNDQTITFNLIIQFPDNNEDQDSEKGKTFNGKIVINKEIKTMTQSITELYANNNKDANGITPDGLQKDGTGAYNIQNVSATNEKYNKYNISLLGNESNNILADTETDSYDNLRYVGANPNNYLKFNDETWRIVGVFNNITTIDKIGKEKKESLVKIVRNDSLGNYSWDSSESKTNSGYGISEWSQADLMTELNTDYINPSPTSETTLWFNGQNNTKNGTYEYRKNIKSSEIDKVAKVRWNTSIAKKGASALNSYNQERSTPSDNVPTTNIWDGKIALIYPSDYGYASTDTACRDNMSSKTNDVYNCKNENWLFNSANQWTLSPSSLGGIFVLCVTLGGNVDSNTASDYISVRPTLFLKSDVVIAGGAGKESDPFILE